MPNIRFSIPISAALRVVTKVAANGSGMCDAYRRSTIAIPFERRKMNPLTVLKEEHRAVERVLRVLNRAADRIDEGKPVSPAVFEGSLS